MNPLDSLNIPEFVQSIWDALEQSNFPTFLVGGAVRDIFLNQDPHDFDLATSASPDQIIEVAKKNFPDSHIDFVGASFGVVIIDGVEVATFRGDAYSGSGNDKDVEISFVQTIEEDLARRDFTFNAMAINYYGELIDPFNGREDLYNDVIRFVGNPSDRIKEDSNRIIRLCRFVAKSDFIFDYETFLAVKENIHLVKRIAPERIRAEIFKAMEIKNASSFWGALLTIGVLDIILPELANCFGHVGGKHHPETVWDHCMLAGDAISPKFPVVKLAGYLHDIGKPAAWKRENGDGFNNHHEIGADILEIRLKELRFTNEEILAISGLVRHHMRMVLSSTKKAIRKTIKVLNDCSCSWRELVRIRLADHKSNLSKNSSSIEEVKDMIRSFKDKENENIPFTTHSLAISGKQLIDEWELKPGPIVSNLQKFLLEYALEEGKNEADCLLLKSKEFFKED